MDNLYNTLFNSDEHEASNDDIAMDIIHLLHGHADLNCLSQYYDLTAYNKLLTENQTSINILHMNARSMSKNADKIYSFLNSLTTPPDVLAITETWLNDTNKSLFKLSGYISYHLLRNTRAHGGVAIYITNEFQSEQLTDLSIVNEDIELLTVKITSSSTNYILCAIYRPQSKHIRVEEFTNILSTLMQKDSIRNNKVIVIGDLNINLLEHASHTATNNFLANLQTVNFHPHISRPTRFPDSVNLSEPSLLDHIYTNFSSNFKSGILHFPISDHLPIFLNISVPAKTHKLHKIEFRDMSQDNKLSFSQKISSVQWFDLLSSPDINNNFSIFLTKLQDLYTECFPIKTKFISDKRLQNPWITQNILNSIKTKNDLYKDFKIGIVTERQFKDYRNTLNALIKETKKSYYINIFTDYRNDTRKIWNTINEFYKKKNTTENPTFITVDDMNINDPILISEAFNKFYTNIAPKLEQNLPPSTDNPLHFIRGDYPFSMTVPPIIPYDVIDIINSLKNKKGNVKEISVSLIKLNKIHIAIPVSILFNQSVTEGKFPECLKHATVIPIYKKGPKNDVGNYRPISMLSVFSKIFEKLMKKHLINFLDQKHIIIPEQYGFRKGKSTYDALNVFTEDIYAALDSQRSLLSIYIDFTKAFDTIRHDILLQKLYHYGIRGVIHEWFKDYLSNRSQSTKFQSHVSLPRPVNYGVPQGSVLGPILFLIYINDLGHVFTEFKTILFADDATLYISGDDTNSIIHTANNELKIFYKWCITNRLTVNLKKTYYMLFTNRQVNSPPPLLFHDTIITKANQHSLLGITIDDNMTFKPHISNLLLKLSRIVSLLYLIRNVMPSYVLKILYNAHVLPHFHYCTSIWCNTYPTHLLPLVRLQKKIVRIITNSDFLAHTQPLFIKTNILKLFDINKLQIGTYMYKHQYSHVITTLQASHEYPTRTRSYLRTPLHNTTLFQHSLSYSGPKVWNSIPQHIKSRPSLRSFKRQFKNHILAQYTQYTIEST